MLKVGIMEGRKVGQSRSYYDREVLETITDKGPLNVYSVAQLIYEKRGVDQSKQGTFPPKNYLRTITSRLTSKDGRINKLEDLTYIIKIKKEMLYVFVFLFYQIYGTVS